jgi:hypothetical protein
MAPKPTSSFLAVSLVLTAALSYLAPAEPDRLAPGSPTEPEDRELAVQAAQVFQQLPAPVRHYADIDPVEVDWGLRQDANYEQLVREKVEGRWFAALVEMAEAEPLAIRGRFGTWRGLVEFLAERNALVEVWACGEEGAGPARRIPATELGQLQRQPFDRPTFVTATYLEAAKGGAVTCRIESGFEAAAFARAANEAYRTHRRIQLVAREVLQARNAVGQPDAMAQQEALKAAVQAGILPLLELPRPPLTPQDLWVACEYDVDDQNNFRAVARLYRDSEIRRRVAEGVQMLVLQRAGDGDETEREVMGYRPRGFSDQLEPVPNPIPGRDALELRVKDPTQSDVRKWRVLEFGAPELLKQSALAHFALLNAYLDKDRKALALKQANLGLIVEPIIAGLNIGGGVRGWDSRSGQRRAWDTTPWSCPDSFPRCRV